MSSRESSCGLAADNDQHKRQDEEIKRRLRHIENKILVMSGKGGVGKSSVAAYLYVVLARKGHRVGLMDVDLHGPSIPRMLGLKGTIGPGSQDGKATPVHYLPNMDVISIEPLMGEDRDRATILQRLGGLPKQEEHCARLAAETLQGALHDYMVRQRSKGAAGEKA